jgi:hypothetical protein
MLARVEGQQEYDIENTPDTSKQITQSHDTHCTLYTVNMNTEIQTKPYG